MRTELDGPVLTVSFTAPADPGGGKVARYQVKCSDKPIVDYEMFLEKYAANEGASVTNWWMARTLKEEPPPKEAGTKESFVVTCVPAARPLHFAVRTFDDSSNRSPMSSLATAK